MDYKELFPIGEVARMFHLSVGTLRHYEQLGLLQPEYTNPKTGYRYYSSRQFECLNTIRYLRVLGMSLPQIRDFLNNRDLDKIQELLTQQKEKVIAQERELRKIERKIDSRLHQIEDARTSVFGEVSLIEADPVRLVLMRGNLHLKSYLDLESSLRKLDEGQSDALIFLGKVGVGITPENLRRQAFDSYDLVFLQLDPEDDFSGQAEMMPACQAVSIRLRGSHKDAPAYYRMLLDYISSRHLAIDGFSREITMIDNGLTSDESQFVTEIRIPVKAASEKVSQTSGTRTPASDKEGGRNHAE
ncbi:MAG: MerR family transcriptional regulator [Lachnospiraceae bacterium]|jgi:DNA-binding transcriptional MerR regulator/effector-binding domain-containing protein